MSWPSLIWRNLMRRPARTVFTAVGVGLGVGLIVALPSRRLIYFAASPIPARGARTFDLKLRVSPDLDWKHLLEPYRQHFQATFGPGCGEFGPASRLAGGGGKYVACGDAVACPCAGPALAGIHEPGTHW